MRKMEILICLLLLPLSTYSQAPPTEAVQRLETVKFFAFGGIGVAGTTSSGEKAYRAIFTLAPEVSLNQFEDVYAHGSAAGKIYALVGIRRLAPARFDELRQSLVPGSEKVETMTGCIMQDELFSKVVERIARGRDGSSPKPH